MTLDLDIAPYIDIYAHKQSIYMYTRQARDGENTGGSQEMPISTVGLFHDRFTISKVSPTPKVLLVVLTLHEGLESKKMDGPGFSHCVQSTDIFINIISYMELQIWFMP